MNPQCRDPYLAGRGGGAPSSGGQLQRGLWALVAVIALAMLPSCSVPSPSKPEESAKPNAATWWKPTQKQTWQFQYAGYVDPKVNADIFNLDGENAPEEIIQELKAKGKKLVCYYNAGAWEPYRKDSDQFPESVKGKIMKGWEDEKWLDTRQLDVLMPIMTKRIQHCKDRGFDAVDPDNMDGHSNDTGKGLKPADTLAYFKAMADVAHAKGLGISLKNSLEVVPKALDVLDFAVNEQCHAFTECDVYRKVLGLNKAVVNIEYPKAPTLPCPAGLPGMKTILKKQNLGPEFVPCNTTLPRRIGTASPSSPS